VIVEKIPSRFLPFLAFFKSCLIGISHAFPIIPCEKEFEMDNNYEIYRYVQDEYLSPIVASYEVNQSERRSLGKEFLSALKNTNTHNNNASKRQPVFLVALVQRFFGML
jgi:hypothetical protein